MKILPLLFIGLLSGSLMAGEAMVPEVSTVPPSVQEREAKLVGPQLPTTYVELARLDITTVSGRLTVADALRATERREAGRPEPGTPTQLASYNR